MITLGLLFGRYFLWLQRVFSTIAFTRRGSQRIEKTLRILKRTVGRKAFSTISPQVQIFNFHFSCSIRLIRQQDHRVYNLKGISSSRLNFHKYNLYLFDMTCNSSYLCCSAGKEGRKKTEMIFHLMYYLLVRMLDKSMLRNAAVNERW